MSFIGIIIQARMGSTRLPGKILKNINGRPLLDHVLGRLEGLKSEVKVVVATTQGANDDLVQHYCESRKVICFRGSEGDVLARYFECARKYNFDHIVRLTADNPFTDITELDRLITCHLSEGNDYTHSFGNLPIGIGAEIFSFQALRQSANEGHAPNHREHVNEYIQENPDKFSIGQLEIDSAKSNHSIRLTVDTEEDYRLACFIAEHAAGDWVTTEEAIELCLHSV